MRTWTQTGWLSPHGLDYHFLLLPHLPLNFLPYVLLRMCKPGPLKRQKPVLPKATVWFTRQNSINVDCWKFLCNLVHKMLKVIKDDYSKIILKIKELFFSTQVSLSFNTSMLNNGKNIYNKTCRESNFMYTSTTH